jgi:hypothetical protein
LPEVLRAEKRSGGFELLLFDLAAVNEARLREAGRLGEPLPLSLEELFLDLTRGATRPIVGRPDDHKEKAHEAAAS